MASHPARGIYSPLLPLLALGGIAALGLPSSATAQQTWYEGSTLIIGGAAPKGSVAVDLSVLDSLGRGGAYAAPGAISRPGQRIVLTPPRKAKPASRRQAPTAIAKPAPTPTPAPIKPVQTQTDIRPAATQPADPTPIAPTPVAKTSAPATAAPEPLTPSAASTAGTSTTATNTTTTSTTRARTETPAPAADHTPASAPASAPVASTPVPEPVAEPAAERSVATQPRTPDHVAAEPASAVPAATTPSEPKAEPAMTAKPQTVAAVMPTTPPLPAAAPRATPPVSPASSPAPAVAAPTRTAAVMPVSQPPAAAPSASDQMLRIAFSGEAATLNEPSRDDLKKIAATLSKDSSLRVQVKAYASGTAETASKARRVSLSRALAVRSYLIEQGVGSTRIDVRALGNRAESGPGDRVDLVLVSR